MRGDSGVAGEGRVFGILSFKLCFYITLPRHLLNCVSKTVWCYQEVDFEKANNFLSQLQWD